MFNELFTKRFPLPLGEGWGEGSPEKAEFNLSQQSSKEGIAKRFPFPPGEGQGEGIFVGVDLVIRPYPGGSGIGFTLSGRHFSDESQFIWAGRIEPGITTPADLACLGPADPFLDHSLDK